MTRMIGALLATVVLMATATAENWQPITVRTDKHFWCIGATEAKSKPAGSVEMAETEAKIAKLRELVQPKPGEYVTNIAKIAWERDPWEAAVRAGKEGKPVIAYGPGMVGVPCGYG